MKSITYCIYTNPPNGGPVLMKTPNGRAVMAFDDAAFAASLAESKGLGNSFEVVPLELLGASAYPMPSSWGDVEVALRLSKSTLSTLNSDPAAFPYYEYLVPLPLEG